jgi:type IV secretion system protein VirD4
VMQLPQDDELVLVSGCRPIRAKKARYFEDPQMKVRILPPPVLVADSGVTSACGEAGPKTQWADTIAVDKRAPPQADDSANSGMRREPELPDHEEVAPQVAKPLQEFEPPEDDPDDEPQRRRVMERSMRVVARQITLDPADDMQM